MLTDFYTAFSPACFSLLGLWLVIIAINASAWLNQHNQQRAYAVALYFAAPGTMSLLALINPNSTFVWRVFFIVVSLLGGAGLVLYGRLDHRRHHDALDLSDHVVHWLTIGLYLAIAVLAFLPLHTLRIEGVLLTALILLGFHVALRLMFTIGAPASEDASAADPRVPIAQAVPIAPAAAGLTPQPAPSPGA
jgi:hypothetical protein